MNTPPTSYSDDKLEWILTLASAYANQKEKPFAVEFIPTLVAMAKRGKKSMNAYTTNLINERDNLKKQLGVRSGLKEHLPKVLVGAIDISTTLSQDECAAAAYVDKVFASVSKLHELKATTDENESLKKQLEVALASERDKVRWVDLATNRGREIDILKQELLEARAELLRLQEYFNLQRALEKTSSIAAVTGELKNSLYVVERTDGSIVTHKDEGLVRVLVLKSFNAACEAIETMPKPKFPHPSYHMRLVTEAQVKQLIAQVPMLLSTGEPLRLVR